jgi:hypothetical protein
MSQSLEQRVALLEKNLRFYRYGFIVLLTIIGGGLLMSFKSRKTDAPDLIQAKSFQVVDDNGKVLVDINKEDDNGQISTFTPEGKRLVSLFTTDGGAGGMNTFDKNGKVLFKVTNTAEGGAYMALFNSSTTEVAEWGVAPNESGYFRLNDRDGNKLAWMTYTQDGGGYFSLSNAGKETMRFSTPGAGGRIGVYNVSGNRVAYIGAQETKDGNITTWNSQGSISGGIPRHDEANSH